MKPPTPRLQIGDVVPIGPGEIINKAALGYIKARKTRTATMLAKSTGRAARNENEARARKMDAEAKDRAERLADPYEQAKAFLQRLGYVVFRGKLRSPPCKGIVVGRKVLADERAVRAYAVSLGWNGSKPQKTT